MDLSPEVSEKMRILRGLFGPNPKAYDQNGNYYRLSKKLIDPNAFIGGKLPDRLYFLRFGRGGDVQKDLPQHFHWLQRVGDNVDDHSAFKPLVHDSCAVECQAKQSSLYEWKKSQDGKSFRLKVKRAGWWLLLFETGPNAFEYAFAMVDSAPKDESKDKEHNQKVYHSNLPDLVAKKRMATQEPESLHPPSASRRISLRWSLRTCSSALITTLALITKGLQTLAFLTWQTTQRVDLCCLSNHRKTRLRTPQRNRGTARQRSSFGSLPMLLMYCS